MPSGKLDRDECLTGKDLNYKPSTAEIAKFDCSPSSEYSNKGLEEEDKQDGLLKTLQNIEDKSKEQLKIIGNKNVNSNDEPFDLGKAYNEIEEMDKRLIIRQSLLWFSNFFNLKDFFDKVFTGDISLNDANVDLEIRWLQPS